jgi:hypothetical protein
MHPRLFKACYSVDCNLLPAFDRGICTCCAFTSQRAQDIRWFLDPLLLRFSFFSSRELESDFLSARKQRRSLRLVLRFCQTSDVTVEVPMTAMLSEKLSAPGPHISAETCTAFTRLGCTFSNCALLQRMVYQNGEMN